MAMSAIYMPKDTGDFTQVGPYRVMFWAEPDQRRLFALYGSELPTPAK